MENRISISINIHADGSAWVDVSLPVKGEVNVRKVSPLVDTGVEEEDAEKEADPDDEGILYDNLD